MVVTIVSSSPGRVVLIRSPWTGRIGRPRQPASSETIQPATGTQASAVVPEQGGREDPRDGELTVCSGAQAG